MKNILYIICAAIFVGCVEDNNMVPIEFLPQPDETMTTVTFNFSPSPQQTSRATDENAVSKIQLLLVGDGGQRYYFVPGEKTFLVESIKRGRYDVYAVANFPDIVKDYSANTLAGLTAGYKDGDERIVMSFRGTADFSVGASSKYAVNLARTVAKLRFKVTAADNVTISKMTLCNVPSGAIMFPNQYSTAVSTDMKVMPMPGGNSFSVYAPENLAGTVASITDQKDRTTANAPTNATYLLIEGEVVVETPAQYGTSVTYDRKKFESRVYLGSNTSTDFNVRRNWDYRIEINIASDLTSDYRITPYTVGYRIVENRTPDRQFIWNGFGVMPSVTIHPYFSGSGQVSFKCVVEGHSREMQVIGSTLNIKTDTATGAITASGTLDANKKEEKIELKYDAWNFTPENSRIKYTLTFTDTAGETTEYSKELRFANRSIINVEPQYGLSYFEKTATITAVSDAYIDEQFRVYEGSGSIHQNFINHAEKNLVLTANPLPGYIFKGWYKEGPPYQTKNRISTEPTVTLSIPRRDGYSFYARVEK